MKNQHHKSLAEKIIFYGILVLSILLVPMGILCVGFSSFHPFEDTYYAGLTRQIQRLDSSKKKKIVILGTSSVAFGIDGNLMEEELSHASLDYDVIPFGLYGSLGSKLMMELSLSKIGNGDIILFQPELTSQTLSTYFSSKETYRSFDGNFSYISRLDKEDQKKMLLGFPSFASEKYSFLKQGKKASPSGGYDIESFSKDGNLTVLREWNVMPQYYDSNTLVNLKDISVEEDFKTYVQDFVRQVHQKKADIYFHYCPVNRKALRSESDEDILVSNDNFMDSFHMEILGNPHDAFMDKEFFYDTNFHLNSAGMKNYSIQVASEIKSLFDITTPSLHPKEEPPELPIDSSDDETLDNQDEDCFTYEKEEDGYTITGLSKEGLAKASLVLPGEHLSKKVYSFSQGAFQNRSRLKEITIQSNIKRLRDLCFENTPLEVIHLRQRDPTKISVGFKLFESGKPQIAIPKGSLTSYLANYSWSYYGSYLIEENL